MTLIVGYNTLLFEIMIRIDIDISFS